MESLTDLLPDQVHKDVAQEFINVIGADIFEEEKSVKIKEMFYALDMNERLALWEALKLKAVEFGKHGKKITTVIKEYLRA